MEKVPKPRDWNLVMMEMAFVIATMSKDPSTKVGAVLVSPHKTRISVGYNGFPTKIPDLANWWENRNPEEGEFCKYDLVRHAEMNAITQAKTSLEGWTLYVTHHPCIDCAKNIVAEGIKTVYYCHDVESINMAISSQKVKSMFQIGGIDMIQLVPPSQAKP